MINDFITVRAQLTGSGTPELPGTSGPIKTGIRRDAHFRKEDLNGPYLTWGYTLGNITSANNPVVDMLTGLLTADGATTASNPGKDAEGVTLPEAVAVVAVLVEVTGTLANSYVTVTNGGPTVIALLNPGVHLFESEVGLNLWSGPLTFAASGGTMTVNLAVASAYEPV